MRLPLIICLTIAAIPAQAHAQSRSWYRVAFGLEQSAQKNPAESPYVYSGWGYTSALGYGREWSASSLDFALTGGIGNLRSALSGGEAHHGHSTISALYLRSLDRRSMVGANLSFTADITEQPFGAPFNSTDQFGYIALTLGPSLRSTFHLRHATLTNDVTVPVLDAVELPYSNLRQEGDLHLRPRTLNAVQGITDAVSYHVGGVGARNLMWTYRVTVLHFVADQPRTFARQSLSMTLNFPHRRTNP